MIYATQYDTMNALLGYLTENCCGGAQANSPLQCKPATRGSRKLERA